MANPGRTDHGRRFPVSVDLCPVDLYAPRSPGARLPMTRAGPPPGGPVRSTPERTDCLSQSDVSVAVTVKFLGAAARRSPPYSSDSPVGRHSVPRGLRPARPSAALAHGPGNLPELGCQCGPASLACLSLRPVTVGRASSSESRQCGRARVRTVASERRQSVPLTRSHCLRNVGPLGSVAGFKFK